MAKNQANAKQHPEAGLFVFDENYSNSWSTLSSENIKTFSKKQEREQVCLYSWQYTIMKMKMKMKNRLHRHGHENGKYRECLSMMTLILLSTT